VVTEPILDHGFADLRLVLVPIEHLSATGVSREFAAALAARAGWPDERIALLDTAFALYWSRSTALARRLRSWPPPRVRHIAVVREPLTLHPYAQLLNASAWTLYDCDLDPAGSHPEFAAYLLAHGDRMTVSGEVTMAALHNAAWWLERSPEECKRFAMAAGSSARPDADAFRALAAALPWLRQLRHAIAPTPPRADYRALPGTDLLVPRRHAVATQQLLDTWTAAARAAVAAYTAKWAATDVGAVNALLDWLSRTAPAVLVTGGGTVLWDPGAPAADAKLRHELVAASAAAVRDIHADLATLDRHSRAFRASLTDADGLPTPQPDTEQRGYTYMHRERRMLVYDLDEAGIDRRHGPALPYGRAMLGARAAHEWAHLAVDAGWVPLTVSETQRAARIADLAAQLDAVVAAAPPTVCSATADDLAALASGAAPSPGAALAAVLVRRMPDFQSNLLAVRYLDEAERETYVRQNVRALRAEYPPSHLWRLLMRYLFELQYLGFSAVRDRRTFFVHSTWFDADFLATGVLDAARLDALADAVAAICDCYAVDESKFIRQSER